MGPTPTGLAERPARARFVTACQQTLALGAVVAVLTPAAAVVSLDVVHQAPTGSDSALVTRSSGTDDAARVPQGEVEAKVREVQLTGSGAGTASRPTHDTRIRERAGSEQLVSSPESVTGYASVGVVWEADQPAGRVVPGAVPEFELRARTGDDWTSWQPMAYDADHDPDPGSPDAQGARPGTDAMVVGDVDAVQVRITTPGPTYNGLNLAVIDPGTPASTVSKRPALDTGAPEGDARSAPAVTAKPRIFSRAQWGADESIRDKGSLRYHEVHAGFVHHTVTANEYTRDQVPSIIRGIYAYHVKTRGWSDIGYNYLVDRFGRIWEGRAGGIDRPVVGAHTLGYNDYSFAMSALGNFETVKPTDPMVTAYAKLFAWKLGLHGVDAASTKQRVGSSTFQAINGHRDAGSTACPGKYLYARLGDIRTGAKALQKDWSARERQTDLTGDGLPDVLARRKSDGLGVILPLQRAGQSATVGKPVETSLQLRGKSFYAIAGDWDRDGANDVVWRQRSTGTLYLLRGDGSGGFAEPQELATGFDDVSMLAAVGDMTGDGYPDLMGQPAGGDMTIYPGAGAEGFADGYDAYGDIAGARQIGVGRVAGDGAPDSLVETDAGLRVYPGNGPGGLMAPTKTIDLDARWVLGQGDVNGDGRADLVVRPRLSGKLYLMPGTASGFGARVEIGSGMSAYVRAG